MAGPQPPDGTSAGAAQGAAERRIVSLLFADLVGFTPLSERLDAEDVAAIQDAYFAAARETVTRHGGALEKFIGDAVMAVFGLERTREDDAERAVRAGFALLSAVERLSATLPIEGIELRLRVGVNTGEVVTADQGPDQGRVTGDAVNTAARLQAAAQPGSLLMGEATALAVAHAVESGQEHALELKGKARAVRAVEALGMLAEASRDHALGRLRAPIVGREEDLGWLRERLGGTPAGSAGLVLLTAPPGVGKSRLSAEVLETARREGWVAHTWSTRLAASSGPLAAAAGLVRAAGVTGEAGEAGLQERLAAASVLAAARSSVVADVLADLADPSRHTVARDPAVRDAALLDGLDALAGPGGALWLVEDAHWADEDTLALLAEAARRPVAGAGRRLILVTARPAILERWDPEAGAGAVEGAVAGAVEGAVAGAVVRELPTLESASVLQLVTALVGDVLPGEVTDRLLERADGNPLFVEETLRSWVSAGVLVPDGDGWRLAVPAAGVTLPTTVQAVYAAQIDDLPGGERRTIRYGSVAGRHVPADSLPDLEVADAAEPLAMLARRGMLRGPETGELGDTFTYRHALLRDAAYASLTRAERARLHVRLARWLEEVAVGRHDQVADSIGGHYETALEAAPALARVVAEDLDREAVRALAVAWLERGAERARGMCAFGAATGLFARSLALGDPGESGDRARRLARLGEALSHSGHPHEALERLTGSVAMYQRLLEHGASGAGPEARRDLREGLSWAAATLADVHHEQVQFVAGRDVALKALAAMGPGEENVPDVARARLEFKAAMCDHSETDADNSEAIERALAVVRAAGDERLALVMTHGLAVMRLECGGGEQDWMAIAAMARRLGDNGTLLAVLANGALTEGCRDPAAALSVYDEIEDLAASLDLSEDMAWAEYGRTEALCSLGAWAEALRHGERGLEIAERNGYSRAALRTMHLTVPVSVVQGRSDHARRLLAFYESFGGAFPDSPYGRVMRPGMELYLSDAGLLARQVPDPGRTLGSFDAPGALPSWLLAMERIMRAWVEDGWLDAVAEALRRLEARSGPWEPLDLASRALVRAWLSEACGTSSRETAELARESLEAARSIRAPWWTGRALAQLGAIGAASAEETGEVAAIADALGLSESALRRW